jgi:hypothetical protein
MSRSLLPKSESSRRDSDAANGASDKEMASFFHDNMEHISTREMGPVDPGAIRATGSQAQARFGKDAQVSREAH